MSYELDDFCAPYFGPGWTEFVAATGDGMRVKVPILFRCFIAKSPESAVFKDGQYEVRVSSYDFFFCLTFLQTARPVLQLEQTTVSFTVKPFKTYKVPIPEQEAAVDPM